MSIPSTPAQTSRRGNALVLAASVLVLLVIIATTFVSRTQTGRATAAAVRKEAERQDSVDGVGEDIAQLVANALFVRPVDARYDNAGVQGLVNPLPGEILEDDADGLNFAFSLSSTFPLADQFQFETNFPGVPAATSSNRIRLDPARAVRDSALADRFAGFDLDQRYGVDPWFPGNFAPFEVVPFTNWPDGLQYPWSPSSPYGVIGLDTGNTLIFGDGSPSTFKSEYKPTTQRLFSEGNPVYGPGFGDTRWLRDLEPMAVDQNNDGLLDSFLQWRHLTNISTPENGWRVVFDISDVFGTKELQAGGPPLPNLIDDLSVPVEQWIDSLDYPVLFSAGNNLPGYSIGNTGAAAMVLGNFNRIQYEEQWARWGTSSATFNNPFTAVDRGLYFSPPANLFDLNDLDADGFKNEPGERPIDRFVGLRQVANPNGQGTVLIPDDANQPDGSIAWNISRYLDDSDGDGWTDSFWFLAPGVRDGVRNIVSVSITDNGGRLDLSTATRYSPGFVTEPTTFADAANQLAESGTTGFTPADLALVSGFNANSGDARGDRVGNPEARVGFFDAPIHREGAAPAPVPFDPTDPNPPPAFEPLPTFGPARFPSADLFNDAAQDFDTRLNSGPVLTWLEERGWFQATANDVDPSQAFLSAEERLDSFVSGDSPPWSKFDLSSELELRANESLNTGDVFTRVEKVAGSWRDSNTDQGSPLRGHLFAQETTPFLNGLTTYEWKADLRHRSTVVSNTRNDLLPSWLRWRWRPDVNVDGFPDLSTFPQAANSLRFDLWQIPGLSTFVDPQVGDDGAPNYGWLTGQRTWLDRNGAPYFSFAQDLEALPGGDQNLDDILDFTQAFLDQQSSRLDLREENPWFLDLWVERDSGEGPSGLMPMAKRLPHAILHALTDGDVFGTLPNSVFSNTYFGSVQNLIDKLVDQTLPPEVPADRSWANAHWLKMASAGLSANILSYRDNDWVTLANVPNSGVTDPEVVTPRFIDIAPLYDQYDFPGDPGNPQDPDDVLNTAPQQEGAVPLPGWGYEATLKSNAENENLAMLGLERQPFLVEAFIGNLYATRELDGEFLTGIGENSSIKPLNPFYQEGMRYVDGACNRTTVVAVQIANPFDKPIPAEELSKYRISVSGRHFPLRYARPDDVTRPTFAELDDIRLPLEPSTENRPSSAIFFLCAPDWDNAWEDQISGDSGDDTTDLDTLFKERMIDWLDLACEQDLGVLDSNGDGTTDVNSNFDLDHPPAIAGRWGRTGTIRYRVPSLQEWNPGNPYGDDTYGWSTDPAYYQRAIANGTDQVAPNRDQYDQSRPSGLPQMEIEEGERIVELARIDNDASIRAGQLALPPVVLDTDGDGFVDENLLNHPAAVWVVVDRFDSRELPLPNDEPLRDDEPLRTPGDFPIVPSHANADLVTQAASGNLPLETAMEPLSMWGSMFGFGSAVLPIDLGPGALPQLPRLTMPWPPLDGNRLIDIPVGNPQAQFSWIPGIFFPTNTPQFDTLISYASARRAWGWDTDFNPNDPRTWGVQSNESHPRFTSALQLTVDNSQGYLAGRYFPDVEQANPQLTNGYQTQVAMQGIQLGGDPTTQDSCADLTSSPDGCLNTVDGGQYEWCAIRQFDPRDLSLFVPNANNQYFSKPTRFSGNRNRWKRLIANGANNLPYWADKSFYHTPQPFQLVHKDDDFQQIGEVLNIPLVGHLVDFDPFRPGASNGVLPAYERTLRTFSEFLAPQDPFDRNGINAPGQEPVESTLDRLLLGTKSRARLGLGRVIGSAEFDNDANTPLTGQSFADFGHSVPSLPAGERLLDLFVVDGPGFNDDNESFFYDRTEPPLEPGLADVVPGLVNINTAPTEVMRSIPGWYRTLEPSAYYDNTVLPGSNRTWFAEAVRSWRDRSQASDVPRGNGTNTFPSAANFAFEQAYSYPQILGGNQFAPSYDIRIEDLTSGRFNLIPDPALADDARPFGLTLANEAVAAPVRRARGFAGVGSLRSVDLTSGRFNLIPNPPLGASTTPVNEFANAWPNDIAPQESSRNAEAGSAFTLGSYRRNRQPLSPYRSLQDRDQSTVPLLGGQSIDPLGNQPGIGPLGRTFPSANDPNLAEDPGFGLSVPYDVAANGTAEVFDNDGDGFGDSYFLNQDSVSGDMEDANLLVAAASNVVSTRSDTFTVHFRVRSFKQNPQTLVWDATDPEFIVGESRYVMIVDRSDVDRPGDEPRILMLAPVRN